MHLKKYKGTEYFNRTILNKNTFKSLIQDLVKINIEALNWTGGGEPTQNPYLGEAIKYIKDLPISRLLFVLNYKLKN